MLLHVIADFGAQDLAFAEVGQRLLTHLPSAQIVCTPVPPFATLAAGFVAAQLAAARAPHGTLVFVNVAPRRDDRAARIDNDGERLLWTRSPSGVDVVGVDAGATFAFLAELVDEVRVLDCATRGSQFRSRDLFPDAVARVAAGDPDVFGDRVAREALPAVPTGRIAYVDGFGNLKTTWRWGELPAGLAAGDDVRVTIGGRPREGRVAGGAFAVPEGTLAVAPGSSGYALRSGAAVRWVEVFARGGSASAAFDGVHVGDAVDLAPADPR